MTEAYVTLATNDRYALGALVLGHSLRQVKTTRQLCILITPGVTDALRSQLNNAFDAVINVDVMDSNDSAHLALLKRPELGITFTKLHCWTLIQYTKCVFLDADILAIQNSDELFDQPELSAACDIGWPDCFNSGMFVFSPSLETYGKLLQHAETVGSFDGGDQGLLNTYFTNWNRLSFVYNMVASVTYTYLPAYKQYGSDVKFVHFLGATKPWQQTFHTQSGTVISRPGQEHISSHLNTWWSIYSTSIKPGLPEAVSTASHPEVTSPVYECKHPQEAHETEPHIYHTQSTHTEHTSTYHDHQEQVMISVKEYTPANASNDSVDRTYTHSETHISHVDMPTGNVDNHQTDVNTLASRQELTEEQKFYFVNKDIETCDLELQNVSTSPSSPSAATDPLSEGEEHVKVTPNVSDARQLADSPISQHDAHHMSITSVPDPLSQNTNSSTPLYPKTSHIPSPLDQTLHPKHEVPELPHSSEANNTQKEATIERELPALFAGRRARVPLPPSFDAPFQTFLDPRISSPFSGYRTTKGPLSELADQLTGLNVSESLEEGRKRWEEGIPDFRGKDSFDSILAHIDSKINSN